MKYKKQIIFICLLTFLFFPMSGKYEEPNADVISSAIIGGSTIALPPTGVILACAALAVGAGVVITNPDMLEHVAMNVYSGIKEIPGALETIGENVKVNVTQPLLDNVVSICENLPSIDDIYEKIIATSLDMSNVNYFYNLSWGTYTFYFPAGANQLTVRNPPTISGNNLNITASFSQGYNSVTLSKEGSNFRILVNGDSAYSSSCYGDFSRATFTFYNSGSQVDFRPVTFEGVESICIPYTEKNTENVISDMPLVYFPSGTGSISVPVDKPLTDYGSISVDNPISLPSDLVGDGISADVDTDVDTGVGDGVGDNVVDGDISLDVPSVAGIDFSPLYISLSEYFPFCIPFDLYNMISDFKVSKETPRFEVNFPEDSFIGGGSFVIDFSNYDKIVTIFRYFCLLFFVTNLIKITRRLTSNG